MLYPEAYTLIETDLRRGFLKRFPYGVIYGIDHDQNCIVVVAVSHLHREPFYWLDRVDGSCCDNIA